MSTQAAFDAVGPLLLIGWAEVGPGFLQAIGASSSVAAGHDPVRVEQPGVPAPEKPEVSSERRAVDRDEVSVRQSSRSTPRKRSLEELLQQARREDAAHRAAHQKPISADTLRARLGIGATQARRLVKIVRSEFQLQAQSEPLHGDGLPETRHAEVSAAARWRTPGLISDGNGSRPRYDSC